MNDELVKYKELAEQLYSHSHFHDGEPNPTAKLMRDGSYAIQKLCDIVNSVEVCCGEYTTCIKACVPRGIYIGKTEVKKLIDNFVNEEYDKNPRTD